MTVPFIFANASGRVPAAELDVNFAYVANNVSTANIVVFATQPNITSVGNLTSLVVTGSVTSSQYVGNGNALTNIPGGNVVGAVAYATTANSVAGGNVSGPVAYATTANSVAGANVFGTVALANVASTANAVAGANVSGQVGNALIAATVYTNAQPNITSVGTLTNVSVTGNVRARDLYGISINSNTGNLLVSANVADPALNWTFINDYSGTGIASLLGPVAGYNQRGEVLLPGRFSTGTVTFTGPDYTAFPDSLVIAAGANISIAQTPGGLGNAATYVTTFDENGNWTMPGNVDVAGNISGANILTSGNLSVAGDTIIAGNLSVTGNTITVNTEIVNVTESVTGNITGGNILTGGVVSAVGNVRGANFNTVGLVTATGNITGANLNVGSGNVNVGNVVFASNGSKFNSAAWTLVESFANLNFTPSSSVQVTMTNSIGYYKSNYNELVVTYYGTPFGPGGQIQTTLPTPAISVPGLFVIGVAAGAAGAPFTIQWSNINSGNTTIRSGTGGDTAYVGIYAR